MENTGMTGSRFSRSLQVLGLLNEPAVFYALLLCLFSFFNLLKWPIVAGDTDLWYHLNGGRYLFEHHALPHTSFFSFVSPPREWVDYYWLFQGLVYGLYTWWGYHGLIVLRAVLYLATVLVILRFLFRGQPQRSLLSWPALIGFFCCPFLLSRFLLVRPHCFTYLFIVLFLYILECAPRKAIYLPGLALLWCNLHGIAYPLLLLISGSYSVEHVLNRLISRGSSNRDQRSFLVPVMLSMGCVFLTPHGLRLLGMPWVSTAAASQYIKEFMPVTLLETLSFQVSLMTPSSLTLFNLLLLATCVAGVLALMKRPIRISHLLLCLGGLVLLAKGSRFRNEFVLLALPLLQANPLLAFSDLPQRVPKPVYLLSAGLVLLMPLRVVVSGFADRPAYPFSHRGLPQGIVAFLNRVDAGGAVLNHPNNGGYLQWMLYPRYRIFTDMEVPFLFTDEDMFMASNVFSNETVLKTTLSRYDPSFLTVPTGRRNVPELMQHFPDYVLVFFDDVEVLYVNKRREPAIARQYELRDLDPFALLDQGVDALLNDEKKREPVLTQVRRLLDIDPDGGFTNYLLGAAYNKDGMYDKALPYAKALTTHFPESPIGYQVEGDAWKGLRVFDRAIAAYVMALEQSDAARRASLYKQIGLVYLEQRRYEQAYRALTRGLSLFSPQTTPEDLYLLGSSAMLAGKLKEAKIILTYVEYKIPPDDTELAEKVKRDLARVRAPTTRR